MCCTTLTKTFLTHSYHDDRLVGFAGYERLSSNHNINIYYLSSDKTGELSANPNVVRSSSPPVITGTTTVSMAANINSTSFMATSPSTPGTLELSGVITPGTGVWHGI